MKNFNFKKIVPLFFLIFLIFFTYRQFFLQKKIPLPTDLLVGAYYPWLDYKWGTITGVPVKNPIISDVFSQFFPWKYLIVDIFRQKEIPLWNQFSFSGTPILENYHSAVFFPGNIFLFLPQNYGWAIFIFLQTLLAAVGMFLFLKKYIKYSSSGIIAAIIFCFSGLMTTWTEFGTGTWAAALIPWVLFFIDNYFFNKKIINLILFCFFLSSLYLAGNAQLTFFSSLIISFYIIKNYLSKNDKKIKEIIIISIYLILSIGIASIELFPAYKQEKLSIRSSEAYSKSFNYGLTPFHELIRLYSPDFFGNPTTYNYWGKTSYHENSCFLGTITLAFILPLFLKKYRKKNIFWLIIFSLSIFLAIDSPVTNFIYKQPLSLLTYSSASRIFFITTLSSAILFCNSFQIFIEDKTYRKKILLTSLILIFSLLTEFFFLKNNNVSSTNLMISMRNSIIPLGGLFILIIIIIFNFSPKIFIPILILFTYFDLSRYFLKYNTFVNQDLIFPTTPAIDFLQNQKDIFRIGRLNREIMTPNNWIYYKFASIEGYDPLALENYSRFFNRVNQNKYNDGINRYSEIYSPDINFLSSLNVKYLLSVENEKIATSSYIKKYNLKPVFKDKSTIIYENKNFLPRAYFVKDTNSVKTKNQLAEIIDKENFNPLNKTIILSDKDLKNNWSIGSVNIKQLKNNSILIETSNDNDGFLVIANTYHSGWNIYIDNIKKEIYEVNGGLCGVVVSKGNHSIKMKYWPKSVDIGIKISIFSIFSVIVFSLYLYIINKINHK